MEENPFRQFVEPRGAEERNPFLQFAPQETAPTAQAEPRQQRQRSRPGVGFFGLPESAFSPEAFARGAAGGTAGLVGGAMELVPGRVGEAGAAVSRFGQRQVEQAMQQQPASGFVGSLAPAAIPLGRALQAPTVLGRVGRGAAVGGGLGAAAPTGQEEYGQRIREKMLPTALGLGIGGGLPAALGGFQAARGVVQRARGKEVEEAGKRMTGEIEQAAGTTAARLRREEEAAARPLQQQQREAQRRLAAQEEARTGAQVSAEAAAGRERLAGRGLAGVRAEEEFGQFGLVPRTLNEVGDYVRQQASRFIESIKEARRVRADREITQARASAEGREAAQPFVQSREMLALKTDLERRLATETEPTIRAPLQLTYDSLFRGVRGPGGEIAVRPSFASAEAVRRRLGDAAFKAQAEGYEAMGQANARDLYRSLNDAMKAYEPSFARYLENYKRLSEPLEVANTRLGRAIMGTERDAPNFYSATGEQIANSAFRTPESVRALTEAFGGNKQIVNAAAERYFANRLVGKSAEEMRKFLTEDKTRAVLRELGPEFRARINERVFQPALIQAQRGTAAGQRARQLDQAVQETAKDIDRLEKSINALKARSPEIQRGIEDIQAAIGSVARNEAASRMLTRLRPELDSQQFAQLQRLVDELKTAHQRQAEARKRLLLAAGGLGLGVPGIETLRRFL